MINQNNYEFHPQTQSTWKNLTASQLCMSDIIQF